MKTGQTFRNAPQIAPRLAACSDFADRVRCTMYWSVHQYQMPATGDAIITPAISVLSAVEGLAVVTPSHT